MSILRGYTVSLFTAIVPKPVSTYAISVLIGGFGEFGEFFVYLAVCNTWVFVSIRCECCIYCSFPNTASIICVIRSCCFVTTLLTRMSYGLLRLLKTLSTALLSRLFCQVSSFLSTVCWYFECSADSVKLCW